MPALNNSIFDSGLNQFNLLGDTLHILSADPGLTFGNIATMTLGNKASPVLSSAADRGAGGREITVSAITDGSVTGTGTANNWAITDDGGSAILASGDLASAQGVTSGNTFTLTQFTIGIPDPV